MAYLMAIDLGTSSVKTLIMTESGQALGISQETYLVQTPAPGYAEQDMTALWQATARTIRQALAKSGVAAAAIAGIGFSGQMHGLVLVDDRGQPVRPAIIWADQRSSGEIAEIYRLTGQDRFRNTIQNTLSPGFLFSSLYWIRQHEPASLEKTRAVLLPKDFLRLQLCGEIGTDISDASATGIFDSSRRTWAYDLIAELGLPTAIFPTVHDSTAVAGSVSQASAELTGLAAGTPVVFGGGDSMMHSIGNGIIASGTVAANIGTACQVAAVADRLLYDPQFRTNTFCHAVPDSWITFGGNLNGGSVLKWLRASFLPHLDYRDFDAAAAAIPAGCEGLLFLPYLTGERTPWHDPLARAIAFGLTSRHDYRHLIRAAMEGVVLSMRQSLTILRAMGFPVERLVASGGGARSEPWLAIMASAFQVPVYTVTSTEEACTGAALVAGVGVGVYDSLHQACQSVVHYSDRPVDPDPALMTLYADLAARFETLYRNNRDLFQI